MPSLQIIVHILSSVYSLLVNVYFSGYLGGCLFLPRDFSYHRCEKYAVFGLLHLGCHGWSLRSLVFIFELYFPLGKWFYAESLHSEKFHCQLTSIVSVEKWPIEKWAVSLMVDMVKVICLSFTVIALKIFVLLALSFHSVAMIVLSFVFFLLRVYKSLNSF